MTEIQDPEIDLITRWKSLLAEGTSDFYVTQALAYCSSIVLWTTQAARSNRSCNAFHSWIGKPTLETMKFSIDENNCWTKEKAHEQIDRTCSYQVLIAMRNCFAHLDDRLVKPVNEDMNLKGFELFLGPRSAKKNQCKWHFFGGGEELRELGKSVAETFLSQHASTKQ